ncbi:hypothetical protein P3T76_013174 [Phytophthora citrophthora]|uniref:Uncharacterized protein n=1 Tax=Phytophthora citrophthora TaxID=4793 RepID=A0AAD9LCC3_9STRA|nr:hypothetical protein P3T76_013174 [Phytophthora citrophthora]
MRRNEEANNASAKAGKVECEFCGKSYKARGLTHHQNSYGRRRIKRRDICFESTNVNAFAHILSFLSNQSVVKLQAATGAIYAGSNTAVSAGCFPCEKDELVIANGLCLGCNRAKTQGIRETITTTDARKLYRIHDINNMRHSTHRMQHRGYYSPLRESGTQCNPNFWIEEEVAGAHCSQSSSSTENSPDEAESRRGVSSTVGNVFEGIPNPRAWFRRWPHD